MRAGPREQKGGIGGMSSRVAAWLGWLLWVLTVVFCGLSLFMPNEQNGVNSLLLQGVWLVASSSVGAVIVSRRSGNPIGWILCAIGFLLASSLFSGLYAFRALVSSPGSLPAGEVAAWFSAWVQNPAYLLFLCLFLLFPEGRPLSHRWRPLLWIVGIVVATSILVGAFYPGPIRGLEPVRNPLGIEAAREVLVFAGGLLSYLFTALLLASVISVYLRFRRGSGTERQQIKWLAYAAALLGVTALVGVVDDLLLGGPRWWFLLLLGAAFLGIPLSIGAAMLHYRLYEIDLIINCTLVYGSLTALLALVYFGGVATTQAIFHALTGQEQQPQLAIVFSTLVIAALFNPLRRRIQGLIDRRFYRRKYDARKTLEAFSAKLRDKTDLEALNVELVGVVRETMQPTHVSLWLRPDTPPQDEQPD
jgi:hypothetical protein